MVGLFASADLNQPVKYNVACCCLIIKDGRSCCAILRLVAGLVCACCSYVYLRFRSQALARTLILHCSKPYACSLLCSPETYYSNLHSLSHPGLQTASIGGMAPPAPPIAAPGDLTTPMGELQPVEGAAGSGGSDARGGGGGGWFGWLTGGGGSGQPPQPVRSSSCCVQSAVCAHVSQTSMTAATASFSMTYGMMQTAYERVSLGLACSNCASVLSLDLSVYVALLPVICCFNSCREDRAGLTSVLLALQTTTDLGSDSYGSSSEPQFK